eukprot:1601827-Prymnesium_polylepis.1
MTSLHDAERAFATAARLGRAVRLPRIENEVLSVRVVVSAVVAGALTGEEHGLEVSARPPASSSHCFVLSAAPRKVMTCPTMRGLRRGCVSFYGGALGDASPNTP